MASTENVRCTGKKRNLGEISVENCQYRGEGNSSIVITLKKEEKVLRLKKSSSVIEDANSNTEESIKKSHLQADFIKHVMRGLLGHYYVPSPELVPITNEEIELVNRAIHEERPAYRCKKTIPEDTSFGLLLPDFCTLPSHLRNYTEGPVLAVEIKPKQGFLPPSYWLSKDNQVKSTICRFHLVQQYKKKKGLLSACSTYCPLDLFSGCSTRMNQAVRQLLLHPQNNLRIFKGYAHGEVLQDEERRHMHNATVYVGDVLGEISQAELEKVVKATKLRRATSCDDIPAEFLKYGGKVIWENVQQPGFQYAVDILPLTSKVANDLEKYQREMARWICRVPLYTAVDGVYGDLGWSTVSEFFQFRKVKYVACIDCMDDSQLPKLVYKWLINKGVEMESVKAEFIRCGLVWGGWTSETEAFRKIHSVSSVWTANNWRKRIAEKKTLNFYANKEGAIYRSGRLVSGNYESSDQDR